MIRPVRKSHDVEREAHPLGAVLFREGRKQERQLDVLIRGEHRQQVEGLEHEADVARAPGRELSRRHRADVGATDADGTSRRLVETGDEIEQRRLAGARRPHQRREAARRNIETEVGEDVDLLGVTLERLVDVANLDQCHGMLDRWKVRTLNVDDYGAVFTRWPSRGVSTPPTSSCSPPESPERISRKLPLTGPASTSRLCNRPSRTIHTTSWPLALRTASAGTMMRGRSTGWAAPSGAGRGGARNSTFAPISVRMRGSRSTIATFTCTVARWRSAVGTTWRTEPRNAVSG